MASVNRGTYFYMVRTFVLPLCITKLSGFITLTYTGRRGGEDATQTRFEMEATEQYFPVVLFIMLHKVDYLSSSWVKS